MKIEELLEKAEHDVTLSILGSCITDYMYRTFIPLVVDSVYNHNMSLIDSVDIQTQKEILHGEKIEISVEDDVSHKYCFYVGKVGDICSDVRDKVDEIAFDGVKDVDLYYGPTRKESSGGWYPNDNAINISNYVFPASAGKKGQRGHSSVMSHELRHALDNCLSKGGFQRDYDRDDVIKYLTTSLEAGARFTQVIHSILKKLQLHASNPSYDAKAFIKDIDEQMKIFRIKTDDGHLAHTDKQYRRFYSRALKIFDMYKKQYE